MPGSGCCELVALVAAATRPSDPAVHTAAANAMRLLVVEDEKKVASFIQQGLEHESHGVDLAHDGRRAIELIDAVDYDLLILDLGLPQVPGLDVLRHVRAHRPHLPVLVLTARGAVEDRVAGLDLGADDYLVKPFAFAELSARVRALLRRGYRESAELRMADLVMDVTTRRVSRAGQRIELTSKEFALLEFLLRSAHRPVSRTMIIEHVWDIHFDSVTNVVEVYVNYLRNKVDKGFSPRLIHTVRGVGYMLSDRQP
jgi:DNA-binding response OmpR family regulator